MRYKLLLPVLFSVITFFSVNINAQSHWESIVLDSDNFNYLIPQQAPSASWTTLTFDDSSWSNGVGGFGYGDNDDRTTISTTTSIYLRKVINIPEDVDMKRLVLDMDYDDAFVAYINGTEIARSSNLPNGTPGLSANLSTDHEANLYQGGTPDRYEVEPTLLQEGDNILAVHVLNISTSSSDMSARVFLHAEIDAYETIFNDTPSWFTIPVSFEYSNIPIIKINTNGLTIVDEPKIMAEMQVINNANGINYFSDTTYEYDAYAGIEIRGNTAQMYDKKSYTVETRFEDGSNNNVEFLGMPKENDWVFHGPYSDKSMMRNALAYFVGNNMGHWCPRARFAEVVINEEYRGVYLVVEKIKIDKNRVDIATLKPEDIEGDQLTGGYIMSIDRDQEGSWNSPYMGRTGSVDIPISYVDPKYDELTGEQRSYIREYITNFEHALHGSDFKDPALGYQAYIDVESFIDYMLITELSRDLDGYRVSVFFHKDKDSKDGKLNMSPFWDYNLCFGNANFMEAGNPVGWAADGIGAGDWYEIPFWWDRFREDPYFETVLKFRWEGLRENVLAKSTINHFIDSCQTLLSDAQARNFDKFKILDSYVWPNNYVGGTYANEVDYLKSWVDQRIDWLDEQIDAIVPAFANAVDENLWQDLNVTAYPNPFEDQLKLSFYLNTKREIDITVRNLVGQTILQQQSVGYAGKNEMNLSFPDLNSGSMLVYTITLDGTPTYTGKILKK